MEQTIMTETTTAPAKTLEAIPTLVSAESLEVLLGELRLKHWGKLLKSDLSEMKPTEQGIILRCLTSWSIGTLGNSGMGLPSRTMDAYSIEALPTYKLGKFSVGPDFDYRWEGQIASLNSGGGTNLAGHGWLLGLGTNYALNEKFSLQGSINLLGNYTFADQTSSVENDHLSGPLGRVPPR